MLKEKMKQVKTFVADHKKEIAICVGVVVGGVVVYKIVKKVPKQQTLDKAVDKSFGNFLGFIACKDLDIPKTDIGTIDELWQEGDFKNLIFNDITVADMGKIGEEFLKIDGVTKETVVSGVLSFLDETKE